MSKDEGLQRDWHQAAQTLSEALPYILRYAGKTVLIKYGGHAMGEDHIAQRFARDIAGSKLVVFDDLGHVPHEEDPVRTVAVVKKFLGL